MTNFNKLPTRKLGENGPQLPRLGLGLMNISGVYGIPGSDAERLAFLDEVYKMGETFWDTGTSVACSPFKERRLISSVPG
jgi:aryl-alcohol dehydrogenase-like predicted oxidoreductase